MVKLIGLNFVFIAIYYIIIPIFTYYGYKISCIIFFSLTISIIMIYIGWFFISRRDKYYIDYYRRKNLVNVCDRCLRDPFECNKRMRVNDGRIYKDSTGCILCDNFIGKEKKNV